MDDAFFLQRERRRLITLAVISLGLLGGALYLQFVAHMDPCPLCIMQRYAYLSIAIFALIGSGLRNWSGIRVTETLILFASAGGIATAAKHVWIQAHPALGCGYDALEPIVDGSPLAKLLPSVFQVSGLCDTAYPPVFGLTLPQWSLAGLVLIFVLVARSLLRRRTPSA
jgi:disulfide bond formation protein DsbB